MNSLTQLAHKSMPERVLALRSELCNAALASPSKMAAAFDRVREQIFSSTPLPASGKGSATAHEQRAKHAAMTEAAATVRKTTRHGQKYRQIEARSTSSSREHLPSTGIDAEEAWLRGSGVISKSANSASAGQKAIGQTTDKSREGGHAFKCADQITDSDNEGALTCDSNSTSECEFEGDACNGLGQETEAASDFHTRSATVQLFCAEDVRKVPRDAISTLSQGSNAHVRSRDPGQAARRTTKARSRRRSPVLRSTSNWCVTLRSVLTMFVCLAVLELGVSAVRRYSVFDSIAAAAGIPMAAGGMFQRNTAQDRELYPQQPLAVQLPEADGAAIVPQAIANEIRMKLVKGGSADEYRVLLDVSTVQAALLRRGQARLCLTVHKQQVGPAPPNGNRGWRRGGRQPPTPPRGRGWHPMAHLPFAQNCADPSSTSALLAWQSGYSARLAGRQLSFADTFTALRGGDLWREFMNGAQSETGMSVVQLHFLLSGLRPGSYRVSVLLPTVRGQKLTAQTLLRVARASQVQAPSTSSYTDELGIAQVMAGGFAGLGRTAQGSALGSALAVTPVFDSGLFDDE